MATDDVNEIKARWYKENLMGRVADKMKEILSPRGEKFFLFYNPNFQNFESEIEYKGRILSVWAIYPYSEVGDYDIGEPEYCANLGDIVVCPEFKQALEKVEKEEGIVFHPTDAMDINDCLLVAGQSLIDYDGISTHFHLENEADLWKFWKRVSDDLSIILSPEFELRCYCQYGKVELVFKPVHNLLDIIDCSTVFKDKMLKVADYCDKHLK